MKIVLRIVLGCAVLLSAITPAVFAQSTAAPGIQWAKSLGGTGSEFPFAIVQTSDRGFVVAGSSNSDDGNVLFHHGTTATTDAWIIKLDSAGALVWRQSLGGSGDDVATDIRETSDSGYIVSGYSNSSDGDVTGNLSNGDSSDYWIVKLDRDGFIDWEKSYGGTGDDRAMSIEITSDGGYCVAGFSNSKDYDVTGNHGDYDYWILRLDKNGNLKWEKSLGGSDDDEAISIRQTPDRGFIAAGYSLSLDGQVSGNHGGVDFWIVKLDSNGALLWQKSLGGPDDEAPYCLSVTSDSGSIVAGYTASGSGDVTGNHGQDDFWVVKLDATGALQWEKTLGGSLLEDALSVRQLADGGYIVAGQGSSNDGMVTGNHGDNDYWVVKLDSSGNLLWEKSLGGSGNDIAYSVDACTDGGFIVAGSSLSDDGDITDHLFSDDFWIVKLGPPGFRTVTNRDNPSRAGSVYPNPFTEKTTVQFAESNSSASQLLLYNSLGIEVRQIEIPAQVETITVDRLSLAGGFYYYRVVSNGVVLQSGTMAIE